MSEAWRSAERTLSANPSPVEPWLVHGDALAASGDPRGEMINLAVAMETAASGEAYQRASRARRDLVRAGRHRLFGDFADGWGSAIAASWWRGMAWVKLDELLGPRSTTLARLFDTPSCHMIRGLSVRLESQSPRDPERSHGIHALLEAPASLEYVWVESSTSLDHHLLDQLRNRGVEVVWDPASLPTGSMRGFESTLRRLRQEHPSDALGCAAFDIERMRGVSAGVLETTASVTALIGHLLRTLGRHHAHPLALLEAFLALSDPPGRYTSVRLGDAEWLDAPKPGIVLMSAQMESSGEDAELAARHDGRQLFVAAKVRE